MKDRVGSGRILAVTREACLRKNITGIVTRPPAASRIIVLTASGAVRPPQIL